MSTIKTSTTVSKFEVKGGGLHLSFRVTDEDMLEVQNLGKIEVSTTIEVIFEFEVGAGNLRRSQGGHNLTLQPREKTTISLGENSPGFRIIKIDDSEVVKIAV